MKTRSRLLIFLILFVIGLPFVYNLPPIQERFGWRVAELAARFKYALSPPEKIVFVPQGNDIWATPLVSPQSGLPTLPSIASTATPSNAPSASPSPIAILMPIPKSVQLEAFSMNTKPGIIVVQLLWRWRFPIGVGRVISAPLPRSPSPTHAIKMLCPMNWLIMLKRRQSLRLYIGWVGISNYSSVFWLQDFPS